MLSLFRLDVGRADHLGPLRCFRRHEVSEIGRRPGHRDGPEIAEPSHHPRIGKSGIDLPVELVDDRSDVPRGAPSPNDVFTS